LKLLRRGVAPFGPTNTRPFGPGSDHRRRCSRRSGMIASGMATSRTPAADFGRATSSLLSISVTAARTVTNPAVRSMCRRRSAISSPHRSDVNAAISTSARYHFRIAPAMANTSGIVAVVA
jgi:hypothetical protein